MKAKGKERKTEGRLPQRTCPLQGSPARHLTSKTMTHWLKAYRRPPMLPIPITSPSPGPDVLLEAGHGVGGNSTRVTPASSPLEDPASLIQIPYPREVVRQVQQICIMVMVNLIEGRSSKLEARSLKLEAPWQTQDETNLKGGRSVG